MVYVTARGGVFAVNQEGLRMRTKILTTLGVVASYWTAAGVPVPRRTPVCR
jgi:hypothetical protein